MRSRGKKRPWKKSGAAPASKEVSSTETEVKLRVGNRAALLRRLKALGVKLLVPRTYEMNTLYDTPSAALASRKEMLRIRIEHAAPGNIGVRDLRTRVWHGEAILTYKGPGKGGRRGYKVRMERELHVADADAMSQILAILGLRAWFRYEKFRSTYRLPSLAGAKIELDETPIGDYLEIEGSRTAIDRVAALVGFRREDYIAVSYGALFMEQCGLVKPGRSPEPTPHSRLPDMLFLPRNGSSPANRKQ